MPLTESEARAHTHALVTLGARIVAAVTGGEELDWAAVEKAAIEAADEMCLDVAATLAQVGAPQWLARAADRVVDALVAEARTEVARLIAEDIAERQAQAASQPMRPVEVLDKARAGGHALIRLRLRRGYHPGPARGGGFRPHALGIDRTQIAALGATSLAPTEPE